ncbi:calcium and integrin-binding family member 2-like [Schistocerca gregaria]|uniref:calcium and integrin-binding family member 2-like n=1 Tax=Schistocerca gregaria TaxID=7010 RepID=UPI00211EF983|nr:calcium and integrin-binding family member 2-like [Schistocerca gregaria]
MGGKNSTILKEDMEDYIDLSYLNMGEIKMIEKIFYAMADGHKISLQHRFPASVIKDTFPQIQANPFADRIIEVFSSQNDNHLSFEDLLDMFSVLSENCPDRVKALWIFKIYDFDGDTFLKKSDLINVARRLTGINTLEFRDLETVANNVLKEADISQSGALSPMDFVHLALKLPEFSSCFTVRL